MVNLVDEGRVDMLAIDRMVGIDSQDYRVSPVGRAAESPLWNAVIGSVADVNLDVAGPRRSAQISPALSKGSSMKRKARRVRLL